MAKRTPQEVFQGSLRISPESRAALNPLKDPNDPNLGPLDLIGIAAHAMVDGACMDVAEELHKGRVYTGEEAVSVIERSRKTYVERFLSLLVEGFYAKRDVHRLVHVLEARIKELEAQVESMSKRVEDLSAHDTENHK